MSETLTPQAIEHANIMLSVLSDRADSDWRSVMKNTLSDAEVLSNTKSAEGKLVRLGLEEPVGAILGGTGVAKEISGLSGEDGQIAIQTLKETNRLQQCGRGRGKCLIILTSAPLTQEVAPTESQETTPSPSETVETGSDPIDPNDVSSLARAIRDAHRSLQREFNEARRSIRALEKDKDSLVTELEAEREKVRELEAQLERQQVASWA